MNEGAAHHETRANHGSYRSYLTGFLLSVVLTAIPFWLVMSGALNDRYATAITIAILAGVQMVVHMYYFLHMDSKAEGGWSMLALIFTLILVVIAFSGSLCVMYHLNTNMMPVHDMSQMA